ncbi:MAG: hypothetical protein SAJ12_20970 [Jaaginema sp. PMC 1079.18]|nr:hypothetical protein [Jaaginema sp. PMC 1080.18]MEC4853460.1 hypothetical protein [Jaaginema sp. PMC 1079.18]MEC4868596.1 hypothetical protein [Jaaginema sp. PMC 1078.18]
MKFLVKALLTAAVTVLATSTVTQARPGVPITNIEFWDYVDIGDRYLSAMFTVPDRDTTRNAGGGLRRYDIHIAKMFEVTDWQCRNWRNSPIPYQGEAGIVWIYEAANGEEWMGIFTIDCQEARRVMSSFTNGGNENTNIFYFEARHRMAIPTLRLTGSPEEAARWRRFVQSVPPQSSP